MAALVVKKSNMRNFSGRSGQVMSPGTMFFCYAGLFLMTIIVLYPILWLAFAALKTQHELTFNTWGFPKVPQFSNFVKAWTRSKMGYFMTNSIVVSALTVVFTNLACIPLAFVLSRFQFRFKRLLYFVVISGMMIPINSAIIPLYILANNLKMMNSLSALALIYGAFRIPISVFILEGFMSTIPRELEECAHIDGCSIFRIFWNIAIPLSRDTIATVSILSVLNAWNELMVAMLLLSKQTSKTLPIGLMGFISEYVSEYTQLCAGILIAIIPNIIFYIFAQEKIQKGITAGAIKG
ncbi:ABC transporter permease [Spirochaetia bacterium]|nr:ABC transporter permease [Spirochaetia bacterium]